MISEAEVYERIGEAGFERIVAAFYRQVPNDSILGPMYPPDDMEGAEERLREFLVFRFGGPQRYIEKRGHPRLRMRHAPFAVTEAARNRWFEMMDTAITESDIDEDAATVMRQFFAATATFLINR